MTLKMFSPFFNLLKSLVDWGRYGWRKLKSILMPKGLLYRFVLIILIPMMVLELAVLIFFFDRHWNTVSHRLSRDVVGEIGVVASLIQTQNLPQDEVDIIIQSLNNRLFINLYFEKNARLVHLKKTTENRTK